MTATDLSAEIVRWSPSDIKDNGNDRLASTNGTHTIRRSEDISNNNCASNTRNKSTSVTWVDIGFTLISFVLYIGDILSDGWLAYSYYTRGHWCWFTFTLIVLVVPAVISTTFSSFWYVHDYHVKKKQPETSNRQLQYMVIPVFLVFQPALR